MDRNWKRRRLLVLAAIGFSSAAALTGTASAATLQVPGQYATFQAAYNAAASGDTIQVAAGTYGAQTVPSGSKTVVFRGGTGVVLRSLNVAAANVTLDAINVNSNAQKVTSLEVNGANTTFKNLTVRNNIDTTMAMVTSSAVGVVFDNVIMRDAVMTPAGENAGVHMECMYSQAANITIRNSYFENCSVMDVFFTRGTWWGQPEYGGWTLMGNTFKVPRRVNGQGTHFYSVLWAWQSRYDRAVVRGNTYEAGVGAQDMNGATASFTNSVESCNTPVFGLRGMVREACGATPEPTPTPTPTPTPSPTPSPTPEPTPTPEPAYEPDCAPGCDDTIAQLQAQVQALKDKIAAALAALN